MVSLMFAAQSYAEVDPGTAIGIWLFDDGDGDIAEDSSGNGNDGTLLPAGNGPTWTDESKFGGALEFNGAGSYIEFATGQRMKTPHLTIMAWFNTRKIDGYGHIFQTGNDWNDMAGYVFRVHQDGFAQAGLGFAPGNVTTFLGGPQLEIGRWYHMALTYDGTTANLYVDGENVASTDGQGEIMYDDRPVRIGVLSSGTGSAFDGFIDEVGLFDVALGLEDVAAIMTDGLKAVTGGQPLASRPDPADGGLHTDTWVTLSWKAGDFAVSHDVYLGETSDSVDNATVDSPEFRGNQASTYYVAGFPGFAFPEGLVPGMTYYWRIDEVNDASPDSPWKGDVWSFMIPPKTAYNPDPADGAEGVASTASLKWTAGYGAKVHTVYFGDDFETVSNAAGGLPQGTTTYKPAYIAPEKVYYWRVDEFDGLETYKGDVWGFSTPGAADSPQPANGATAVPMTTTLSWSPAATAVSHDIYFGTDKDTVKNATIASPEYKGNKALGAETYDPGKLALAATCYWRVDAVYSAGPVKGLVWSFTTGNFLLVDDFESYNDIDPPDPNSNRIFDVWIDGFGTTDNGALVGNDMPPYAEQTVVHGGAQSLIYRYDNTGKTSEATVTLVYPRDWTEENVTKLSLWFRGGTANSAEKMYIALNGNAVVYHDNAAATQKGGWNHWVIDLQAFADLGVNLTNVNTMTIGIGTKGPGAPGAAGGTGTMYFDDIRLIK